MTAAKLVATSRRKSFSDEKTLVRLVRRWRTCSSRWTSNGLSGVLLDVESKNGSGTMLAEAVGILERAAVVFRCRAYLKVTSRNPPDVNHLGRDSDSLFTPL